MIHTNCHTLANRQMYVLALWWNWEGRWW